MAISFERDYKSTPVIQTPTITDSSGAERQAQLASGLANEAQSALLNQQARLEKATIEAQEVQFKLNVATQQQRAEQPLELLKVYQAVGEGTKAVAAYQEKRIKEDEARESDIYLKTSLLSAERAFTLKEAELIQNAPADGTGLTVSTQEYMTNVINDIVNNAPSEAVKIELVSKLGGMLNASLKKTVDIESNARKSYRIGQLDDGLNQIVNRIIQSPNDYAIALETGFSLIDELKTEGLSDKEIEEKSKQFYTDATKRYTEQKLETNVGEGLEFLKTGIAGNLMDSKVYADLMKTGINKLESLVNDENAVFDKAALQALSNSGLITNPLLKNKLGNKITKSGYSIEYEDFQTALVNNNIPNPELAIVEWVKDHNETLPAQLEGDIKKALAFNNPANEQEFAKTLFYAGLVDTMSKNSSSLNAMTGSAVTPEEIKKAQIINYYASLYPDDTKQIAALVTETLSPVQPAVEKLRQESLTKDTNFNDNNKIGSLIEDSFDINGFSFSTNDSTQAAIPLYRQAYIDMFNQTGNADLANNYALAAVKTRFGVTDINGSDEIMEYAPEIHPLYRGLNINKFNEQLAIKKEMYINEQGLEEDFIKLTPNELTPLTGEYSMTYQNPDTGEYRVLENYKPDFTKLSEAEQEQLGEVDAARKEHAKIMQKYNVVYGDVEKSINSNKHLTKVQKYDIINRLKRAVFSTNNNIFSLALKQEIE